MWKKTFSLTKLIRINSEWFLISVCSPIIFVLMSLCCGDSNLTALDHIDSEELRADMSYVDNYANNIFKRYVP